MTGTLEPIEHSAVVSIVARVSPSAAVILASVVAPWCKTRWPLSALVAILPFSVPILGSQTPLVTPLRRVMQPLNNAVPEPPPSVSSRALSSEMPVQENSTLTPEILLVRRSVLPALAASSAGTPDLGPIVQVDLLPDPLQG